MSKHYVFRDNKNTLEQISNNMPKDKAIKFCINEIERTKEQHYVFKQVDSIEIDTINKRLNE